MGMQNVIIHSRSQQVEDVVIYPYFGAAPLVDQAGKTGAFILSLPQRGETADRKNSGALIDSYDMQTTMYYAYPVSYGQAVFTDITPVGGSYMQGGWDGASGDGGITLGPIIVPVMIAGTAIDFYLYQTDYPNNGEMLWRVT